MFDNIEALLRGWEELRKKDVREHPVIRVRSNPFWREDVIRRDRKEGDNVCGYASRPEVDWASACSVLPYCDPKCPCNFGMTSNVRDNNSEGEFNDAYWEERNVAPTGGFREFTDAEYRNVMTEDDDYFENIIRYGGVYYMCNDAAQYGIHLRSKELHYLDCLRYEIWEYEDQVRREMHREIVKDTYNELREDGNGGVDALFSNPELFTGLYMEYCNQKLDSVYMTVLNEYESIVWDHINDIYDFEEKYELENRLPEFTEDDLK